MGSDPISHVRLIYRRRQPTDRPYDWAAEDDGEDQNTSSAPLHHRTPERSREKRTEGQ